MRIRTIKPEFWSHPVLARLTDEARLVAIGLLNVADDEGFFLAAPALVRSALYPFDEDSTRIRRVLDALSRIGYIEIREHPEQGEIGVVVNFAKHQRIDRATKSKIRAYFDSTSARRVLDEDSLLEQGRDQGKEQGREGKNTSAKSGDLSGAPKKERARDPLFDALASACDRDPRAMTARDARACGVALAEIRKATPDVTPEEIARRATNYRARYREAALTPSALCNQWAACATSSARIGEAGSVRPSGWGRDLPLNPSPAAQIATDLPLSGIGEGEDSGPRTKTA